MIPGTAGLLLALSTFVPAAGAPEAAATRRHLEAIAERVNTAERARRKEYYDYLVEKEGQSDETFEQHLERYGALVRMGPPATAAQVDAVRQMSAVPLPADLVAFYGEVGSFSGGAWVGDSVVHAPEALLAAHAADAPKWQALASIGLVDRIRSSWGNDRFEFDPASGEGLTADEVARLNAAYSIVGWRSLDAGEAFEYLYFDAQGRFGTVYYHQDAFDELYTDSLKPMLERSPASATFSEALAKLLDEAERNANDPDSVDSME